MDGKVFIIDVGYRARSSLSLSLGDPALFARHRARYRPNDKARWNGEPRRFAPFSVLRRRTLAFYGAGDDGEGDDIGRHRERLIALIPTVDRNPSRATKVAP